tara:strand:- start:1439 stop:2752 length:1314 start_codon:yes stop_codon:yes gene_type:complete
MYFNLKKFINKYFIVISFIGVVSCFAPLFYFSTKFMVNNWAYADALINYSEGFIRRGLLGEILLFIYKLTEVELSKIYSYLYILVTLTNISLFILILKNIDNSKLVFLFLLINPVLLFFPLNDTLGYMRKEMIMLTLMLFHCYICSRFHNNIIDKNKYKKFLYFVIMPGIIVNTLMHDMQLFLIPFHFLLSVNVLNKDLQLFNLKEYFKFQNLNLSLYLITLTPILIFLFYPSDIERLEIIAKKLSVIEPNLWDDPIKYTSNSFFSAVIGESKFMFSVDKMGSYKHLFQYPFLLFISLFSIIFIFKFVLKDNIKIYNNHFLFLSLFPIFLLFFIGRDWGRWLSMICWATVLYYLQFKIKIVGDYFFIFKKKILSNILVLLFAIYYSFFLFLPHCCKDHRTLLGGFYLNVKLAYELAFKNSSHLDKTFRKHGKGYEPN